MEIKFNFYFEKSGGNKGAGKTGEKDDKFYQSGKLLRLVVMISTLLSRDS